MKKRHSAEQIVAQGSGGPAWADAGVICPWAIHQVYVDKTVLKRYYDSMVRFVNFRVKHSSGFLAPKKFHCFGNWMNIKANTP